MKSRQDKYIHEEFLAWQKLISGAPPSCHSESTKIPGPFDEQAVWDYTGAWPSDQELAQLRAEADSLLECLSEFITHDGEWDTREEAIDYLLHYRYRSIVAALATKEGKR